MAMFIQFQQGNLPLFRLNFGVITLLPKKRKCGSNTTVLTYLPVKRKL